MASRTDEQEEDFVAEWLEKRIPAAIKFKEDNWENPYEIAKCKEFWQGQQLDEPLDEFNEPKVQINRVHPSVKTSMPSLYFHDPFCRVHASPAIADTPGQQPETSIDDQVQLMQDFGNTVIRDKSVNFDGATHMALKEAQWAFGCVHVRLDATPYENPAIETDPNQEQEDTPQRKPAQAPQKRLGDILGLHDGVVTKDERFYVRRIPARQVLCSALNSAILDEIAWVGYWALYYVEDIKKSPMYKGKVDDLEASGAKAEDEKDDKESSDKIKLYHIWSLRDKIYYVFAEGHKRVLTETRFKRLPLKFLMLDQDPDMFFPIPPIYQMLHPQREINDSREWLRLNRKGTVARYTYDRDAMDPKDMKKLESGDMGTYVPRNSGSSDPVQPIAQPNYAPVAAQTLAIATQEFNELSTVTAEQRGVPQSDTATQAKIIELRSQAEESFDRILVAKWLASIVEELIMLAVDKMSQPMWILNNADPEASGFQEAALNISAMWRSISYEDMRKASGSLDRWWVTIEPGSMSPVAEAQERDSWLQALSTIKDPIMTQLLVFSPEIRKKTLRVLGVKSAREQELIAQALSAVLRMQQMAMMAGAPPPPGQASQPGAPKNMSTGGAPPPNIPPKDIPDRMAVVPPAGRVPM